MGASAPSTSAPATVWSQPGRTKRSTTASRSGHSVRVIGYSGTAHAVLTVILVDPAVDASEHPDGEWWGSNAWVANDQDRRLYGKEDE